MDTTKFIVTQEFNRLTKIKFNTRTAKASKTLQLKNKQRIQLIWEIARSTTTVDPQILKVKEQDISLTKNYCITNQHSNIGSIHKLIFKIKQISGSCELRGHNHFLTTPTQKSLNQFPFLNLYQHVKKSLIHLFIFEIQSILQSCHQIGNTQF